MNKFLRLFFIAALVFTQSASAQQWTWVNGNSYPNAPAVFGTKGVPAAANVPAARTKSVSWTDADGNFWLMGGSTSAGLTNDLWKFNPVTNQWAWMSGSNLVNQPGTHGDKGLANAANTPGAREGAISWADNNGNLWLMGGSSYNPTQSAYQDDLWKYNIASGLWTFMAGSDAPVTTTTAFYGTKGVPAGTNYPGARYNSVSWTDNGGNLWLMGGSENGAGTALNDLWKYDTTTNQWTWMSGGTTGIQYTVFGTKGIADATNTPGWRSMAFTWTDDQNNLWLMGGYGASSSGGGALNDLWKYNTSTGTWTWMGGSNLPDQAGTYGTMGVESSINMPGARSAGITWNDKRGNLWLMGGADDLQRQNVRNDLWKYNIASGNWTWMSGSNVTNQTGVYGTKGVPSLNNVPGARSNMISWIDNTGALYLMGGSVYVQNSAYTLRYQDLWSYKPAQVTPTSPGVNYSTDNITGYLQQAIKPLVPNNTGGAVPENLFGSVSTIAGNGTLALTDGTGVAASFNNPAGLTIDGIGNIYVADSNNGAIRKITSTGVVTTFAQGLPLNYPTGVTLDASGNLYVTDQHLNVIRKITRAGVISTFAGGIAGDQDGVGTNARFFSPSAIVTDAAGNMYITDEGNHKIKKISTSGVVTTIAGSGTSGYADGLGTAAIFKSPHGIAVDPLGNLYVTDITGLRIRKITPVGMVTTLAGSGNVGSADGSGTAATFSAPRNIIVDATGNLYVTDQNLIRKITPAGLVTTIAGNSGSGSADGIGAAASFNIPWGVALNTDGNLIIADTFSGKIRKLAITGYSINPALPAGLTLSASGIISGTPTQVLPKTEYTITAYNAGGNSSAKFNITINKITPMLTVTVPDATYGDADITPLYVANTEMPVTLTSANSNLATIVNGKIHIVGAGTATITALQAGNDTYSPIAVRFIVKIKPQELTVIANDETWNYGKVTELQITYNGFVNGDDASKLTTQPTVTTTANPAAPVMGTYSLIPSGAASPNYTFVYVIGKLTVTPPASNLKISATSVTCKGSNNGIITFDPVVSAFYTAAVTSNNYAKNFRFNTKSEIDSLAPGTYHICIGTDNLPDYQQCSDVTITEPKDLAVYATVNKTVNTVTLALTGSDSYTVKLNGTEYQTSSNSITLPLSNGSNKISVNTDRLCQGTFEQLIDLSGITAPYPNPFQNVLYVNLGEQISAVATIDIFNMTDGRRVLSQIFNNQSGVVRLEVAGLKTGIYNLNLTIDGKLSTFKIVKQ